MNKREIPSINAGSMADIAFLLLIFFLVATTMNIDSGLQRLLPPPIEDQKPPEVKERNVLIVLVNRNDQLMVENEVIPLSRLRARTREFLLNEANDDLLPEKEMKHVPPFGKIEVTKGLISLQNDKGTSYNMYVGVLNELVAAGNEIKNEFSLQFLGKSYDALPADLREAVREARPAMISEADPVKSFAD